jgi:hypothetical protein
MARRLPALRELSEVPGSGGENDLVPGAVQIPEARASEVQDAFAIARTGSPKDDRYRRRIRGESPAFKATRRAMFAAVAGQSFDGSCAARAQMARDIGTGG